MTDFSSAKAGDKVTLTDGSVGKVRNRDPNYAGVPRINVEFPPGHNYHEGGLARSFCLDGRHYNDEIPNIQSIGDTMATPYDAEIANAEKALADLKAKAIAEAAKATVPELAAGQKWKTRGGRTVTIKHTRGQFVANELSWWYGNHRVSKSYHSVGNMTSDDNDDLVELVGTVKLRWYTDAEFVAFAATLPAFALVRELGKTKLHKFVPVGSDGNWYFAVAGICSDVEAGLFNHAEYSIDAGKTWNKFGIEE